MAAKPGDASVTVRGRCRITSNANVPMANGAPGSARLAGAGLVVAGVALTQIADSRAT
jgi:hypothetical protein